VGCLLLAWQFPIPSFAAHQYVLWGLPMYASFFWALVGSIAVCYQETFLPVFCCAITGYTIHQCASDLEGLIKNILMMAGIVMHPAVIWGIALLVVYIPSLLAFSRHIRETGQIRIDSKKLPFLSVMVLLVDIMVNLYRLQLQETYTAPGYDLLINLLNALACVFILNLQGGLIANRNLQVELNVVQNMLQEEKRQYENSKRNIEIINQKCHDLKHQLRTLRKQTGEVDRTMLKEIEQAVEMYDTSTQTGNAALDVILTEKKLLCESKGVTLTCIADGSGLENVSPSDIYALFGNILDNAIEAVDQLDDPDGRSISLSVRRVVGMTVIHEENRYHGEIMMEDGLPVTRKDDTDYHGFGMKSIRMIAENYNGYISIDMGDSIFSLTVMLVPEESQ